MIIALAVIITNVSILYLLVHLKKLFKSSLNECEVTMRELTENALDSFIKEIRRQEEQYHSSLYVIPKTNSKTVTRSTNTENHEPIYEKSEERKKEDTGEKISRSLRAYHAKKNFEKEKEELLYLQKKKEKARERTRAWTARKKEEKRLASMKKPTQTINPYNAFVRPGDVIIQ